MAVARVNRARAKKTIGEQNKECAPSVHIGELQTQHLGAHPAVLLAGVSSKNDACW
jgi:hypothetical protein